MHQRVGNNERETTPFVFTSMMAHVLGGKSTKHYKRLETLCGKAYNILRDKGAILMMLLDIMRFSKSKANIFNYLLTIVNTVKDLQSKSDLEFLQNRLMIGVTREAAAERFRELMTIALNNSTRLNKVSDA